MAFGRFETNEDNDNTESKHINQILDKPGVREEMDSNESKLSDFFAKFKKKESEDSKETDENKDVDADKVDKKTDADDSEKKKEIDENQAKEGEKGQEKSGISDRINNLINKFRKNDDSEKGKEETTETPVKEEKSEREKFLDSLRVSPDELKKNYEENKKTEVPKKTEASDGGYERLPAGMAADGSRIPVGSERRYNMETQSERRSDREIDDER